ncbi:MAG TPA: flagella basal body P-ring formation protein FlgA [Bacteriovoracaceae bacterium]|nr:flagella basal body P-ring formation protein FlgA [Bacteriovoracaceae bacterium]
MLKKAIAFSFLVSSTVFACEVTLPYHLIVLGPDSQSSIVKTEGCPAKVETDLREILMSVEGKISAIQIQDMLLQKSNEGVTVTPPSIHVKQLSSLIRDQLQLPAGIHVKSTSGFNYNNIILLSPGDMVEVECASCLFGTAQPLKLSIKGFDGVNRTVMATADFKKMVRAYRFTISVNSFAEIKPRDILREVYVESIPHTDLVTDLEKVKFYKTNKSIKAGELLRLADLNAINLVRAGLKTEVILENTMVRIKTQGISRSNGSLGELVEVFHQEKNKKYLGKVIDLNKVLVEL